MSGERWFGDRRRVVIGLRWAGKPRITVPTWTLLLLVGIFTPPGYAQDATDAGSNEDFRQAVRELRSEVQELRGMVAAMRSESERARAETEELRKEVEKSRAASLPGGEKPPSLDETALDVRGDASTPVYDSRSDTLRSAQHDSFPAHDEGGGSPTAEAPGSGTQEHGLEEQKRIGRAASLEEEYDLLSGKVDEQYQTKVESASKYKLRISGIVLMNLFSNQGTVDNLDLPMLAFPRQAGDSGGSFGATLRQSEIGFEVFGPEVAGARTRADLQLDLAGGFPSLPNGVDSGLVRLRTGTLRMDWLNTSVVAGQDAIFFSPNSPTSFATLAQPALSYAGNLWGWVPQIRVEHRITLGERSSLLLQGGILDPVSGEVPGTGPYRASGAGESSRQPAYATRIAWTCDFFGRPLRLGVGGFYGRQDYGFSRNVDAWAATSDVDLPLGTRFELSGKVYRGRALGGLYGGFGQSVLFNSMDTTQQYTQLIGLNDVGGWAQLKYRATSKLEFNWAFGMANPYAKDLKFFPYPYSYGNWTLSRNRAGFGNVIYRPRSDLLLSAEYRQMETNSIATRLSGAGHLNLMMGVLF